MAAKNDIQIQLEECKYQLNLLKDIASQIGTELELTTLLNLVADKAREVIQADTLLVPIINADNKKYSYMAASGKNAETILKQEFDINIGMCGWVLTKQEPLLFGSDNPWLMGKKTIWEEGMESALLVPLISRGRIVGGISGMGKKSGGSFTKKDLEILQLFANQVSTVIENAQIIEELEAEKELAEVTLYSIGDAVITTDEKGIVTHLNPVAESLTGWESNQARGQAIESVMHIYNENSGEQVTSTVYTCIRENRIVQLSQNLLLVNRQEHEISIQDSAAPIRDKNGKLRGSVLVFRDVSKARQMERQMSYQANHDALTGLYNRHAFEDHVNEMIEDSRLHDSEHVLVYIDLDQFKIVNDTCGHIAGDELLRQIAQLLHKRIRKEDMLARLGGDEFGLLLTNCGLDDGLHIAESIRSNIYDFTFAWQNSSFNIGCSIGLVPFDADTDNYDGLLSAADSACYAAKDLGRNRINVYKRDDLQLSQRKGEMRWIPRINLAIADNSFQIYSQPIAQINKREKPSHFELLIRMEIDGKIIPPNAFIPAAERYNKMMDIDRWVIETVLTRLSENKNHFRKNNYSINISGQSLSNHSFLDFVKQHFKNSVEYPQNICFEITETAAIADMNAALNFINGLKDLGCKFSLDDFGSGLSSFGYLKNLPVDFIKIDGMFVKDICDDPIDYVMVEAITKIAHEMKLKTIAEFAENEGIIEKLVNINVDFIQGYHVGIPGPWELD